MNAVDGSRHYEQTSHEQNPSLLTVILDTNPAAWSVLSDTLSLSQTVGNLLILVNAHLACNYTNKVAVIASHCDAARWLYPTSNAQHMPGLRPRKRAAGIQTPGEQLSEPAKRLRLHGSEKQWGQGARVKSNINGNVNGKTPNGHTDKYPLFHKVEEEILTNLSALLRLTDPGTISSTASTRLAGALTLALSYINRQNVALAEASGGALNPADTAPGSSSLRAGETASTALHSRILLVSVSQAHDLAHQYIPIINSIFACQRLSIPIDVCQIPMPNAPLNSTVFLQQASDATKGVYIPLTDASPAALLQFLMMAFLPTQASRLHLVLPTRIDVDFRAACFCHRRVIDIGFVCSICLSIFCLVPENGDCLTCGTHLELGDYGGRPMVIPRQKRRKKDRANPNGSQFSTPTPGPA